MLLGFTARSSPFDSTAMLRLLSLGWLYQPLRYYHIPYFGQMVSYMFCMIITINSDYVYEPVNCICDEKAMFSLRGTD